MMKALIASVLVAGCVGDAPSDPTADEQEARLDQEQHLIARVKASHGRDITFRMPVAGQLVISQTGPNGVPPIELPGDPLQAWSTLVPDQDPPLVLQHAVAGQIPELADAIEVDTRPTTPITENFPAQAFQCWVKNQVRCQYDITTKIDGDFQNEIYQQFNVVWAVDGIPGSYTHTWIEVYTGRNQSVGTSYSYDTWDGGWRTFQITGTLAIYLDEEIITNVNNTHFHYSTARWQ